MDLEGWGDMGSSYQEVWAGVDQVRGDEDGLGGVG